MTPRDMEAMTNAWVNFMMTDLCVEEGLNVILLQDRLDLVSGYLESHLQSSGTTTYT